jgi:hypothetical protein
MGRGAPSEYAANEYAANDRATNGWYPAHGYVFPATAAVMTTATAAPAGPYPEPGPPAEPRAAPRTGRHRSRARIQDPDHDRDGDQDEDRGGCPFPDRYPGAARVACAVCGRRTPAAVDIGCVPRPYGSGAARLVCPHHVTALSPGPSPGELALGGLRRPRTGAVPAYLPGLPPPAGAYRAVAVPPAPAVAGP